MVEMTILHITHAEVTDITTTQHHFDHHTQTMFSEMFTTGGQTGKEIAFINPIHVSIPIMSFINVTSMKIMKKHHKHESAAC